MNTDGIRVKRVVIAGGGTAGWIAAAALSQQFHGLLEITLIESDEIGTVGVGESTIPPIRAFHGLLQIDEQEFMRATAATFKLGIRFEGWRKHGETYFHPFGSTGKSTWACQFHHFWLHSLASGMDSALGDYCLEHEAARLDRFALQPGAEINYAYHLDASIYARFLRRFSERFGVQRLEGKIRQVQLDPESGFVTAVELESGQSVPGDLFIDCTGFRGLLIEQALKTGYEDWNHWLPCDSALAVQTESVGPAVPYTRAIAHEAGWRWRIPLQHRVGNGLVFANAFMSDEAAREQLLRDIEGPKLIEPRLIRFRTGRRRQVWNRNVVALGLASGFIEPLESTSIHLIITGVVRLIQLFPFAGATASFIDQYNEDSRREIERIRDFIILHYHANERTDGEFWRNCANLELPDSLLRRLQMFREQAHAWQGEGELFRVDSWTHVMLGQGIRPVNYHGLARSMSSADMARLLESLRGSVQSAVAPMPSHQEFVDRHCRSGDDVWNAVRVAPRN
jgi:tryptophan halogenase